MTKAPISSTTPEGEQETIRTAPTKRTSKSAPLSKKQQLVKLLNGKTGADVATISTKLGWQQHTTRAALTGLRKAGYELAAEKPEGNPSRYRIVGQPVKAEQD